MATLDFLHPLTGDTVSTTVEVVIAYDFQSHFVDNKAEDFEVILTISLTSANAAYSNSVPKTLTITAANAADECTHVFNGVTPNPGMVGDYVLNVVSNYPMVPPTDREDHILVTSTPYVSVESIGPPIPSPVTENTEYLITGKYDPNQGDQVQVRKKKLLRGQGWHEVGNWEEATLNAKLGTWEATMNIGNDQANHRYNFTARLRKNNQPVPNGQASKGRKSIA